MASEDLDMMKRDPLDINSHVKVDWYETIAEPDGIHSIDCVWSTSFKCFNFGKNCCYRFLTFLCGICIALYWGCEFGMTAFYHVWCCTPQLRNYAIWCGMAQKCFGTTVNCFLAPICEACSMFLSSIQYRKM